MGNEAGTKEKDPPVPELWRGDIAAGKAGGKTLGDTLLGNAGSAEEVAAAVKANPAYAGPILGAAAKRLGNDIATKAAELCETTDHSAHVYDRASMASCDLVGDDAKDATAPDPGTKLPFDEKTGGWDGVKIASRLGQYDKIGGTDNDGDRCTFANLLTTKVLAGAAATKAYFDNVYARIKSGTIELKDGRDDAMAAAAKSLQAVGTAIEKHTATYGDLSWAQESLYEIFVDTVGSGTFSKTITNFLGEDQGYFTIGKELSGSAVPHNPAENTGCIVSVANISDWTIDLAEGEAYLCAWIGPVENPGLVSHQVMLTKQGGKVYLYDPERHGDGRHMIPINDAQVKTYFKDKCRFAVTFKMNAPAKPAADAKDTKKKGATAGK